MPWEHADEEWIDLMYPPVIGKIQPKLYFSVDPWYCPTRDMMVPWQYWQHFTVVKLGTDLQEFQPGCIGGWIFPLLLVEFSTQISRILL